MKGFTIFAALVSAALAAPTPEAPRRLRTRASRANRKTLPPQDVVVADVQGLEGGAVHPSYDSNWAGGVLVGSGYTEVTGTITVPTPKEPSGGSSRTEYSASAWVGIDGDTCQSAILQTGVDFYVEGSQVSYDAWYEWFPDYAYYYDGITISAGNQIKMTVVASSTTSGTATIENLSTGQTVSHSFTNEGSEGKLCETNAEWIIEDFAEISSSGQESLVPFANFGTVSFTNAYAIQNGAQVTPAGATIFDIGTSSKPLTSCSGSSSGVSCSYV